MPLARDLSRALIGDPLADALGYPPLGRFAWLHPAARPIVTAADLVLRAVPSGRAWASRQGAALWDRIISDILSGMRPDYRAPTALVPRRRARPKAGRP